MLNLIIMLIKAVIVITLLLCYDRFEHRFKNFIKLLFSHIFNALIFIYYIVVFILYIWMDFSGLNDIFVPELVLFFFLTISLLLLVIHKKSVTNDFELKHLCEISHDTCNSIFFVYLISIFSIFVLNVQWIDFSTELFLADYFVFFKFDFYYIFDVYTFISKVIVILCFLVNLHIFKSNYCFNLYKKLSIEYPILLGFIAVMGCLAISSNDLFIIFILFEIISFLIIYLIIINANSISVEAAVKFFFLNSFVGALGFIGILIIYLINGFFSTNLDVLASTLSYDFEYNKLFLSKNSFYLKISCFLIFLNFFFKFGVFPVHIFIVDVYSALSMSSVFFISTTLKLVYTFIFIKLVYYCFGSFMFMFSPIISFIALVTYGLGVFGAYNETNIKKFLAYSSISHAGFMFFSLAGFNTHINLALMLFYFSIYILSNVLLFSVILGYIDLKNNGELFTNFNDFYLLNYSISSKKFYSIRTSILNKFFVSIAMLALMGLPPILGFIGKYFIFLNLFTANYHFLVLVGLLFSVLSGVYYFSLILNLWYNKEDITTLSNKLISIEVAESPDMKSIRFIMLVVILVFFIGSFFLLIDFSYILEDFIKFVKSSNPWV